MADISLYQWLTVGLIVALIAFLLLVFFKKYKQKEALGFYHILQGAKLGQNALKSQLIFCRIKFCINNEPFVIVQKTNSDESNQAKVIRQHFQIADDQNNSTSLMFKHLHELLYERNEIGNSCGISVQIINTIRFLAITETNINNIQVVGDTLENANIMISTIEKNDVQRFILKCQNSIFKSRITETMFDTGKLYDKMIQESKLLQALGKRERKEVIHQIGMMKKVCRKICKLNYSDPKTLLLQKELLEFLESFGRVINDSTRKILKNDSFLLLSSEKISVPKYRLGGIDLSIIRELDSLIETLELIFFYYRLKVNAVRLLSAIYPQHNKCLSVLSFDFLQIVSLVRTINSILIKVSLWCTQVCTQGTWFNLNSTIKQRCEKIENHLCKLSAIVAKQTRVVSEMKFCRNYLQKNLRKKETFVEVRFIGQTIQISFGR